MAGNSQFTQVSRVALENRHTAMCSVIGSSHCALALRLSYQFRNIQTHADLRRDRRSGDVLSSLELEVVVKIEICTGRMCRSCPVLQISRFRCDTTCGCKLSETCIDAGG